MGGIGSHTVDAVLARSRHDVQAVNQDIVSALGNNSHTAGMEESNIANLHIAAVADSDGRHSPVGNSETHHIAHRALEPGLVQAHTAIAQVLSADGGARPLIPDHVGSLLALWVVLQQVVPRVLCALIVHKVQASLAIDGVGILLREAHIHRRVADRLNVALTVEGAYIVHLQVAQLDSLRPVDIERADIPLEQEQ